ncbi:MAG: glutathione transferase GstA [Alphaproteobacteria bacterium]|nr:glutathione transferase GstA [Alphaproteobacteria bacterium]
MKLYYAPGACSLSPHIALREAGLDFDLEQVDLAAKKTRSGADYRAINPLGYVPALQLDDGTVMTEASVIAQYVADATPGAKLAPPAGSRERYGLQTWLNFIATEIHKGIGPLWKPTTPDAYKETVKQTLAARFDYLSEQLGDKPYLTGDRFTIADGYLFTVLNWTNFLKLDMAKWPKLTAYMARVAARPAVQAALKAEGLAK